jgi:hypothetical protein
MKKFFESTWALINSIVKQVDFVLNNRARVLYPSMCDVTTLVVTARS